MYNVTKYVFGFGLILVGIVFIIKLSFLGGLLVLTVGCALLPPISVLLQKKVSFWQNRPVRLFAIPILLFVGFAFAGSKLGTGSLPVNLAEAAEIKEKSFPYEDYLKESNIEQLSEERLQKRVQMIEELKENSIYEILIDSAVVRAEFLPVLNLIGSGITGITETEFGFNEDLILQIEESNYGEEKMEFVIKTVFLTLPGNGGMPKDLIQAFERYRIKYGLFGSMGRRYGGNGQEQERIEIAYDLTPIFGVLDSRDRKVLDAIYEVKNKNISPWQENSNYTFGYLSVPEDYVKHVKSIYPNSKVLPNDYDDDFWSKYDTELNNRILALIVSGNCLGLQSEFETADANSNSQKARTGTNNTELMVFMDENLRKLGCYK